MVIDCIIQVIMTWVKDTQKSVSFGSKEKYITQRITKTHTGINTVNVKFLYVYAFVLLNIIYRDVN